eukprot:TRINITY_DN3073_c0_g3_i1.p1 TRINITY_DN3073_c0_g3~~TRINITY_DN3073_c0_g3_i1.p1  ORF type:complete len:449 (-),score=81.36 TRINITY_DN3073_c0_g3_i1:183-1529(-)
MRILFILKHIGDTLSYLKLDLGLFKEKIRNFKVHEQSWLITQEEIHPESYVSGFYCSTILNSFYPQLSSDSFSGNVERTAMGIPLHPCHVNFNLSLNLSLGIQLSVETFQKGSSPDFDKLGFVQNFTLPSLPYYPKIYGIPFSIETTNNFNFVDYEPHFFHRIRHQYDITDLDYLNSLGLEQFLLKLFFSGQLNTFQQMGSYGKSGSIFFCSYDSRFLLKTVTSIEVQQLLDMLPGYYNHIATGPSLLVPILGLIKIIDNMKHTEMYLIVMKHAFTTKNELHTIYDLKGSVTGRTTETKDRKPGVPLKDLDFRQLQDRGHLCESDYTILLETLFRDTAFLSQNNVMDYSLLMGVHQINPSTLLNDTIPPPPAKSLCLQLHRGFLSKEGREVFYFSIIDYLVPFNFFKRLEQGVKGMFYDYKDISAASPTFYAGRLICFFQDSFSNEQV